jgi:hypothetical protein
LADQALRALHTISNRVDGQAEVLGDLDQRLADYSELAAMEQTVHEDEASRSTEKLCTLERNLAREISDIQALEMKLSPTVGKALDRIRFPELAPSAIGRAHSFFEQLVAQYSPDGEIRTDHIEEKVERLRRNYTMADERQIHNQTLGQDTGWLEASTESARSHEGCLPQNVELF